MFPKIDLYFFRPLISDIDNESHIESIHASSILLPFTALYTSSGGNIIVTDRFFSGSVILLRSILGAQIFKTDATKSHAFHIVFGACFFPSLDILLHSFSTAASRSVSDKFRNFVYIIGKKFVFTIFLYPAMVDGESLDDFFAQYISDAPLLMSVLICTLPFFGIPSFFCVAAFMQADLVFSVTDIFSFRK